MAHEQRAKVALICGAGGYLGSALAKFLAADGWRTVLHYRSNSETAQATGDAILTAGGTTSLCQADLSTESGALQLADHAAREFGRVDLVLNCCGSFTPKKIDHLTEQEWREGLDSTVTAAFFISRATLPLLRKTGSGRLIHLGDSMARRAGFTEPAFSYYVGKTGVWMLVQTLAVLEAEHGVTVNSISPGVLESSEELTCGTEYPLTRRTTPADIYGAVRYLASPEAAQVTGTDLLVSGGWNIAPTFQSVTEGEARRRAGQP